MTTTARSSELEFADKIIRKIQREEKLRRDFWNRAGIFSQTKTQTRTSPSPSPSSSPSSSPPPPRPPPSSRPAHVVRVTAEPRSRNRESVSYSPTIGAVSVGVVVLVLLVIYNIYRTSKRRTKHSRCEVAIRQFDVRNNSLARDSGDFSEVQTSQPPAVRALPRSAYKLLECPVCLELAWPPRKIFQCREGHIVCDTCKANPDIKTCPICRISFSDNLTSRNRTLEELARTLKEEENVSTSITPSAPPPDIAVKHDTMV